MKNGLSLFSFFNFSQGFGKSPKLRSFPKREKPKNTLKLNSPVEKLGGKIQDKLCFLCQTKAFLFFKTHINSAAKFVLI